MHEWMGDQQNAQTDDVLVCIDKCQKVMLITDKMKWHERTNENEK